MPWANTPEDKARSAATYGSAEYKRNNAIVRRRSCGRCERTEDGRPCSSRDRVQCDHKTPVSQGGTHHISNLWDLCTPHHDRKTAGEGGGWRRGGSAPDPAPTPKTEW